jgi:hypothetical protein
MKFPFLLLEENKFQFRLALCISTIPTLYVLIERKGFKTDCSSSLKDALMRTFSDPVVEGTQRERRVRVYIALLQCGISWRWGKAMG